MADEKNPNAALSQREKLILGISVPCNSKYRCDANAATFAGDFAGWRTFLLVSRCRQVISQPNQPVSPLGHMLVSAQQEQSEFVRGVFIDIY